MLAARLEKHYDEDYDDEKNRTKRTPDTQSNSLPAPTHGRHFGCQTLAFLPTHSHCDKFTILDSFEID